MKKVSINDHALFHKTLTEPRVLTDAFTLVEKDQAKRELIAQLGYEGFRLFLVTEQPDFNGRYGADLLETDPHLILAELKRKEREFEEL